MCQTCLSHPTSRVNLQENNLKYKSQFFTKKMRSVLVTTNKPSNVVLVSLL